MKKCPLCASGEAVKRTSVEEHRLIDGSHFQFKSVVFHCFRCKEEFSLPESDVNFSKAYKKAQHLFILKTFEEIESVGFGLVDIERLFHLSYRTLLEWRQGDFSDTSVAFLYMLKQRINKIKSSENEN